MTMTVMFSRLVVVLLTVTLSLFLGFTSVMVFASPAHVAH